MKGYSYPGTSPVTKTIKEDKFEVDEYMDEGTRYTPGSNEEQDVIRAQWGDEVDAPVREEDKTLGSRFVASGPTIETKK